MKAKQIFLAFGEPIVFVLGGLIMALLIVSGAAGQELAAIPESRPAPTSQPAVRVIRMKVTAYCLCQECCEDWSLGRRTATMRYATIADGVAADPTLLPYGTVIEIPGVGRRTVDDTGGGMRKSAKKGTTHIDLRIVITNPDGSVNLQASHQKALDWEEPTLDVIVVSTPNRRQMTTIQELLKKFKDVPVSIYARDMNGTPQVSHRLKIRGIDTRKGFVALDWWDSPLPDGPLGVLLSTIERVEPSSS